jgi:hypothetical protein
MNNQNRRSGAKAVIVVLLVVSSFLPLSLPVSAALRTEEVLSASNADFGRGRFGLTALIQPSGVQLMPLGSLQSISTSPSTLCKPLAEMGSAAYQPSGSAGTTYFYLFGGLTTNNVPNTQTCHTRITNAEGGLAAWTTLTPLLPKAIIANKGIAVKGSNGNAFLYSLGGLDPTTTGRLSIAEIYRAPINSDGSIGAWATEALRMPNNQQRHSFALVSSADDSGSTYVYVLGGMRRFRSGASAVSQYFRDAYRSQVQPDGSLGAWQALPNIPIPGTILSCAGLYDSQAVTFPVFKTIGNTTLVTQTIYLLGGVYQGTASCGQGRMESADVYRASLGANGGLTWDTTPGDTDGNPAPGTIYTLPRPLYGHKAVGFNQKTYVLGGFDIQAAGGATRSVFSGYATQDQDLAHVPGGSNFFETPSVLPQALFTHGGESGTFNNQPFLYIFGGRKGSGPKDYVNTVYFAKPAVDERSSGGFPSEGIHVSQVVDLEGQARPVTVTWTATITDNDTDIEIAYRQASTPSAFNNSLSWTTVDGFPRSTRTSRTGTPVVNSARANSKMADRYVQYRAVLRSSQPQETPILTRVSMIMEYDGASA